MLTRVGDEHMGRFVREALAAEGVDVAHVRTDPQRLTGPRPARDRGSPARYPHIFYRENCADMGLEPRTSTPRSIGARTRARGHRHAPVARTPARRLAHAPSRARSSMACEIVLDIDYRPVLWGLTGHGGGDRARQASARGHARPPGVPAALRSRRRHRGGDPHRRRQRDALEALRRDPRPRHRATIVMKRGAAGCVVFEGAIPASVDQGLVVRRLPGRGAERARRRRRLPARLAVRLARGPAARGLRATRQRLRRAGRDAPWLHARHAEPRRARRVHGPRPDARPGPTTRARALHRARRRDRSPASSTCSPSIIGASSNSWRLRQDAGYARIADFKALVAEAVRRSRPDQHSGVSLGVIVDERHGGRRSSACARRRLGRPPGRTTRLAPARLRSADDIGLELLHLAAPPRRQVPGRFPPGDPRELRLAQEARLRRTRARGGDARP